MTTHLPEVTGEKQEVGAATLRCQVCDLPVPVSVELWIGLDEDDDECLFTEANTLDLEAHLASHGRLLSRGGGDEDEGPGPDLP